MIGGAASASGISISLAVSPDSESRSSDTLSLSAALTSRSCSVPLPSPSTEGFDCTVEMRPKQTWTQVTFRPNVSSCNHLSLVNEYALTLSRVISSRTQIETLFCHGVHLIKRLYLQYPDCRKGIGLVEIQIYALLIGGRS